PVSVNGRVTPCRSRVPSISNDLAPVIWIFSERKTILGNFVASRSCGPFTISMHIFGAASISSEAVSTVATSLDADMLPGSNVKAASKRLNRVVYVENPMCLVEVVHAGGRRSHRGHGGRRGHVSRAGRRAMHADQDGNQASGKRSKNGSNSIFHGKWFRIKLKYPDGCCRCERSPPTLHDWRSFRFRTSYALAAHPSTHATNDRQINRHGRASSPERVG